MSDLKPGDRVYVVDEGLNTLYDIMKRYDNDPEPNNKGVIHSIDGDDILIYFDDGMGAPYDRSEVFLDVPER